MAAQRENIESISDEIREELSDDSISITSISFTLRSLLGDLNNLLNTNFIVNSNTLEVHYKNDKSRKIEIDEKAILVRLFFIRYYSRLSRRFLGATGVQQALSVDSDGHSVRMSNPNTTSSEFRALRDQEIAQLNEMVKKYKRNRFSPQHIPSRSGQSEDNPANPNFTDFNRISKF